MNKLRIALAGASGRMGHMLVEAVLGSDDCVLGAALDVAGSAAIGRDAGDFIGRITGVIVGADIESALKNADVLIDFTRPEGSLHVVAKCFGKSSGNLNRKTTRSPSK